MDAERKREMLIRAGLDMVKRADRAVESGEIKGYSIVARASDPAIIEYLILRR